MSNVHRQCREKRNELEARIALLEAAIRKHRDANWGAIPVVDRFDQQLYAVLQEQEK
jgi:hypothetical protein